MTNKTAHGVKIEREDLLIRQVSRVDLPALEWDGEFLKYRRMFANIYRDSQHGKVLMWIVEQKNEGIIGQVFVVLSSNESDSADGKTYAYVFAFRVKPEWRNLGIGSRLMHFVEDDLRERGFKYATLNVAKDNLDALRLYQRLGYRVTGSRPGIWSFVDHKGKVVHVNEPAWRMEKDLARSS